MNGLNSVLYNDFRHNAFLEAHTAMSVFVPALKLAMPCGEVMRMSGFQCHGYEGTGASALANAHRAHFVAVKYAGKSTFGKPFGSKSQP